ncbi:MAG: type II toxin-antitoxin system HicB family antitoxin [Paludibacter sp.]
MATIIVNIDWDDNYGAWIEELPGCVATSHNLEELKLNFEYSLKRHLHSMKVDGDYIPEMFKGELNLSFTLNVRALLHEYSGVLTPAALSRITGINQKQISHYANGVSKPRKMQRDKILNGIHEFGRKLIAIQ